jgi:hypothetical protein
LTAWNEGLIMRPSYSRRLPPGPNEALVAAITH